MAVVRYIQLGNDDVSKEQLQSILKRNFNEYVTDQKVSDNLLEKRIVVCSNCSSCFRGIACKTLGNCRNSREEFFKMHLNRTNGGCPSGQW